MIRTLLVAFAATAAFALPAAAQCDPGAELGAILPAYQARVAALSENPSEESANAIAALAERLNGAGEKIADGDMEGACADYADLREDLGAAQ